MKKKVLLLTVLIIMSHTVNAQKWKLNIDSCRTLAIQNNKELKIANERQKSSHYQAKAAFTNFLPKISMVGTYQRTEKEISLLNEEQKATLGQIGTTGKEQLSQILANNPSLAENLTPFIPLLQNAESGLNNLGNGLVDALRTDTRNMTAGGIILTQPIYTGGKVSAYNKITHYAEKIAASQSQLCEENIIVNTDKAYWTVVSLVNKKALAESYLKLVKKLDNDISKMVKNGVATQADRLNVEVKVNEAEMAMVQVENGLSLSKMALCQICGIPLNSDIELDDESMDNLFIGHENIENSVSTAWSQREELKSLDLASEIYRQKVKIARSEFLPSVALTGNYLMTNPSVYNGFETKFRGNWAIGVMVNIPVFHWGEGVYKVRAAKAEASIQRYEWADAKEKIELEVTQNSYKLAEARKKLNTANKNMEKAEENLRHADKGMKEGVIPISNVLEAQTAWLMAQTDKISAQIDVKLAQLYLQKSLGNLKR